MGVDKSSLSYHDVPQREFLYQVLCQHCECVFTSCRHGQDISSLRNPLPDRFEISGPMNGILSAFQQHPDKAWLIVAIDMPWVDEKVLEKLLAGRDPSKLATCFYHEAEKFPEPLLTLWEPAAFPLLLRYVQGGQISPRDFLNTHPVQLLIPEDPRILLNINSHEEYLRFNRR
jgi:Molybdopterin-guanine dinucleotide biosynthesis protein A